MGLSANRFVDSVEEVIIASGPPRRHRAFPTGVRLPDGDLLVGFRAGSDHHITLDGAFRVGVEAVAGGLAKLIEAGRLDHADALAAARGIMGENAREIFSLS